jgi:predicted dehydrogenase
MKPVRIAVIGVGHMGRLHAEKIAALGERGGFVELAGVADVEPERATQVAERTGTRGVRDFRDLLGAATAAIVAVPTVHHASVVREVLKAGLDVLVEKPIAATLPEAEALIELARSGARMLQVGHLEWFNAAFRAMQGMIRRPRFVEAHRMGPFPGRATDVDVVRDLMIHDLDIVQRLLGEDPERVEAIGVPVLSNEIDIANARLNFPGGCVANFTASRVSPTPMRKLRFFQADGYFSIDFLEQKGVVFRRHVSPAGEEPRIDMQPLEIDRDDALERQLRSFVEAVRRREIEDDAPETALRALHTALRVVEAMPPLEELQ